MTQDRLFPIAVVTDSDGQPHTTPEVFSGRMNVVVVHFSAAQRASVETWLNWLSTRELEHPGFHFYELSAHYDDEGSPSFARRLQLRSPIEHLSRALGLVGREAIAVMTVSVDGLVHRIERGSFDEQSAERLNDALHAGA
jgi:hypothetical protein